MRDSRGHNNRDCKRTLPRDGSAGGHGSAGGQGSGEVKVQQGARAQPGPGPSCGGGGGQGSVGARAQQGGWTQGQNDLCSRWVTVFLFLREQSGNSCFFIFLMEA